MIISTNSYPGFGIVCIRCSETVIAPERSQYVTSWHVRHAWSCDSCGVEFETSEHLPHATPSESRRTFRFLPLLVA
jgi:hypothetical protein